MDERGHLAEAFNLRIDELNVIDMAFLDGCSRPTIGALHCQLASAHAQLPDEAAHARTASAHAPHPLSASAPYNAS